MREPGEIIRRNAVDFYELAMSSYGAGKPMAVICNLALSVELLLKSLDATLIGSGDPEIGFRDAESKSNIWGHSLSELLDKMDSGKKQRLVQDYKIQTGQDLEALLIKCKDYFVHARYAYESSSGHLYDMSAIKDVSEGIQSVIKAWGGTNA